jgi:hypothetical protein
MRVQLTYFLQEVEYLGYYSLAEFSYRVDRPAEASTVARN